MGYSLSTVKSPIDSRDYVFEHANTLSAVYPARLDLRSGLKSVRDQGNSGACAAFTAACIKEYQEKKQVGMSDYISPQFIYNNRENRSSEGMYSRDLMKILNKVGCVEESRYPYGSRGALTTELYHYALNYRVSGYSTILTIDGLKASIIANGPAMMAIPVYNYGLRMWYKNTRDVLLGGHAVAIVGWDETGFIVRNSWGASWVNAGYTTFPYSDWGLQWEVWTTIDGASVKNYPTPPKKVAPIPRRVIPFIKKIIKAKR